MSYGLPPQSIFLAYFRADQPSGGWPSQFAVVTAHNPEGVVLDPGANDSADQAFDRELINRCLVHFRVTGGARDGSHLEPGWGIELASMQPARELSARLGQLGYFWVAKGRLFLVDTNTGESRFQAEWKDRWLGGSGEDKNDVTYSPDSGQ